MDERLDKNRELERNKDSQYENELDALKHETLEKTDKHAASVESKLAAERWQELHKDIADVQKDLEVLETRHQIDNLKAEIPQKAKQTRYEYESMSEEDIAVAAEQWRKQSAASVNDMIQSTSWIPDIIKRNA